MFLSVERDLCSRIILETHNAMKKKTFDCIPLNCLLLALLLRRPTSWFHKISIERTFDHRFPSHPKNKLSVNLKKDGQTKVKRQIFGFIGRRGEIGNVLDAFSIFIAWN